MSAEVISRDLRRVAAAVALAQAEFELAALRRQLNAERWVGIAAVAAVTLLAVLPCAA